jgi:hypothetical protein
LKGTTFLETAVFLTFLSLSVLTNDFGKEHVGLYQDDRLVLIKGERADTL